jgi:hypothetical protein
MVASISHSSFGVAVRALSLAGAAAAVLLAVGCDDFLEVDPEDQRIAVGAARPDVCPDRETGVGEVEVITTVFGTDGSRVEGVEFSLSASRGTLEATSATTDERGEARTLLTAPRTADLQPVVVTAVHPEGETDDFTIEWPSLSSLCAQAALHSPPVQGLSLNCLSPDNSINIELDDKLDIILSSLRPCNLSSLELTLSYDVERFTFIEAREGGIFEQGTSPGTEQPTSLVVADDPIGGVLDVSYSQQSPPDPPGTNISVSAYLILTFQSIALSQPEGGVIRPSRFGIDSYSFADNGGVAYPPSDPLPAGPQVTVLAPLGN